MSTSWAAPPSAVDLQLNRRGYIIRIKKWGKAIWPVIDLFERLNLKNICIYFHSISARLQTDFKDTLHTCARETFDLLIGFMFCKCLEIFVLFFSEESFAPLESKKPKVHNAYYVCFSIEILLLLVQFFCFALLVSLHFPFFCLLWDLFDWNSLPLNKFLISEMPTWAFRGLPKQLKCPPRPRLAHWLRLAP